MMRNSKNKRKTHLLLFCILFCAVFLLIIPLYKISYESIKNRIYGEISYQAEQIAESIDAEALMYHQLKTELHKDSRFSMMKNLRTFEDSSQYIILKNFADIFSSRVNMMQLSNYVYIFFKNNNTAVEKKSTFDNIVPIFNNYITMDDMNYDSFRKYIFNDSMTLSVHYTENMKLENENAPSIVIFQPIDPNIGQPPEAVIMGIYKADCLFTKIGGGNYKEVFDYVAVNDEVIYSADKKIDKSKDIVVACNNVGLTMDFVISEDYFKAYMSGFMKFVFIYISVLLLAVLCLEMFISRYMNRPLRNMVRLVSNVTGDNEIKDEEGMLAAISRLNENKKNYEKAFLMTLFIKPLERDECEFIRTKYPDFPEPFLFAVFYSENLNEGILKLLIDKFNISGKYILSSKTDEFVVFFDYTDDVNVRELRESLNELNFEAKSNGVNIVILMSIPCNGLEEFYHMYTRMQSYYRFVDYDGVFDMSENKSSRNDMQPDEKIYDRLYEYIICGRAFEAQKLVYEQWYDVMTNKTVNDSNIEKVFYSQLGVLAEAALKVGYKDEIVQYDSKMKINELAFSVADNIDLICGLVNSRKQKNGEYDKILEFINEKFSMLNFGMPDVEREFEITGKTINKFVKSCTGKTFTEYVEELRIEKAKKMIETTTEEFKSISEQCGFQNYDTFYKFFKKHEGMSPAKWRRMRLIEKGFENKP